MIKIVPVHDSCMTMDMPGRDSHDKVRDTPAVKVDRSRIGPPAFQKVELEGNLESFCCLNDEVAEPEIREHRSVANDDDRAFPELRLSLFLLDIWNISGDSHLHRQPYIRLNDPRTRPGAAEPNFLLDRPYTIYDIRMLLLHQSFDHFNEEGTTNPVIEGLRKVGFARAQNREGKHWYDGITYPDPESFDLI